MAVGGIQGGRTMRARTKGFLFGLFLMLGLTWVGDAWAFVPAGGSRLLFYFSNKSFVTGAKARVSFVRVSDPAADLVAPGPPPRIQEISSMPATTRRRVRTD
jgi:hypothetical protein